MAAYTNDELLRLCKIIDTEPKSYRMFQPLADFVKSRLQAEAPEDAEVAEIARRDDMCSIKDRSDDPDAAWAVKDRAVLLAKLRALSQSYETMTGYHDAAMEELIPLRAALQSRTSQAEAQAPAVLTEDEVWNMYASAASMKGFAHAVIDRLSPPSTPGNV